MRTLVCTLDLFLIEQKVYLVDENDYILLVGTAELDALPEFLKQCCEFYEVAHIHLFGNAQYVFEIKKEIQALLENVEIEVN